MKPLDKIFLTDNNQPLCENTFTNLSSAPSWLSVHGLSSWAVRKMKLLRSMIVRVLRDLHAGLLALVMTSTANARIYVGLGLMGVIAPLAACAYLLFDRGEVDSSWYHLNYFHLLFLLGPHLFELFCLLGAFLLFPQGSKRAYLIAIPAGYVLAKIVWLISVTNNQEFWQVVPSSFVLGGIAISGVVLKIMNWLTWRQFHAVDSFEAKQKGLYQIANDLPAEKYRSMMQETLRNKYEFNSKY